MIMEKEELLATFIFMIWFKQFALLLLEVQAYFRLAFVMVF